MRVPMSACALLTIALTTGMLRADIPPGPRPRPPIDSVPQMVAVPPPNAFHIVVTTSKDAREARLTVPKSMLNRIREIEDRRQETIPFRDWNLDHLLVAVLLALGGLVLLRGRVRLAFAAVLLLTIGVSVGLQQTSLEASPPKEIRKVRVGEVLFDNVQVEIVPDDGELKLTLPADAARLLKTR